MGYSTEELMNKRLEEDLYKAVLLKFLNKNFFEYNDLDNINIKIEEEKLKKFLWHEYTMGMYGMSAKEE